jgi:hypothetical protein
VKMASGNYTSLSYGKDGKYSSIWKFSDAHYAYLYKSDLYIEPQYKCEGANCGIENGVMSFKSNANDRYAYFIAHKPADSAVDCIFVFGYNLAGWGYDDLWTGIGYYQYVDDAIRDTMLNDYLIWLGDVTQFRGDVVAEWVELVSEQIRLQIGDVSY